MNEFTPPPDFVQNTMERIRRIEGKSPRFLGNRTIGLLAGYVGAAGALLIGIVNLLRMLIAIYAPVVCH
jgi:hypothetical protein